MPPKSVFVLMPYSSEFDDVYMVIRDACADPTLRLEIECMRADEIEKPGTITDQIIASIRGADGIVADLTGSNPNVMYELGYAHALAKRTLIINQSVNASPFDVAGLRQIVYDRDRLLKDCRPRLVSGLAEMLGQSAAVEIGEEPTASSEAGGSTMGGPASTPLLVDDRLVMEVQAIHLRMEQANMRSNISELEDRAKALLSLIGRITVFAGTDQDDLRNVVGAIGNCATELERGERFQEAEAAWKQAIGLFPKHGGIHYQYGDFLVDQGRVEEARSELQRARELQPDDRRLPYLEMKVSLASGTYDPALSERLRTAFEARPADRVSAVAYLVYLSRNNDSAKFEEVCKQWEKAAPDGEKPDAVRALADHLARTGETERAKGIYESLLQSLRAPEDCAAVLHNLATLCNSQGRSDDAERYWRQAHALLPLDPVVRAAFSQFLQRQGKLDLALKVVEGEALPQD